VWQFFVYKLLFGWCGCELFSEHKHTLSLSHTHTHTFLASVAGFLPCRFVLLSSSTEPLTKVPCKKSQVLTVMVRNAFSLPVVSDEYLIGLIWKLVSPVCSFQGLHRIAQENCNIFSSHLSNILCCLVFHFLSGTYMCNILSPITVILKSYY